MLTTVRTCGSLDVSECSNVTDAGLMAVIQQCRELSVLCVEGCDRITNSLLHALAEHAHYCLKSIDITCCPHIADSGVEAMVCGCRSLAQLCAHC